MNILNILKQRLGSFEKIVSFTYREETYRIKVYKDDWEWCDDCVPCDTSHLLLKIAHEYAVEAGMKE